LSRRRFSTAVPNATYIASASDLIPLYNGQERLFSFAVFSCSDVFRTRWSMHQICYNQNQNLFNIWVNWLFL